LDAASANGEVFLYQALVGSPTRLLRFRERGRGAGLAGWLALGAAGLRRLARPTTDSLRVRLGRRRLRGHAVVVTVAPPGDASHLALDLARPRRLLDRLLQAWRWLRGKLSDDPRVVSASGARFAVHGRGPALRVSVDGETRLLAPPIRFRLRRGALRVLLPLP
jgi:diacylglycerol kinase family enzyme